MATPVAFTSDKASLLLWRGGIHNEKESNQKGSSKETEVGNHLV